jgi:molecular chaperone HscB
MSNAGLKNVAPAAAADYFALFELPVGFDLDGAELERRYLERSRSAHPDRFVNAPAPERVAALQRFTTLNEAYNALRRPVSRAAYLLAREGVTIGANEQIDAGFLADILELREELAEATARGDQVRRAALEADMRRRRQASLASLSGLLGGGDLAAAKQQLILLRYFDRFLEAAAEPEDD